MMEGEREPALPLPLAGERSLERLRRGLREALPRRRGEPERRTLGLRRRSRERERERRRGERLRLLGGAADGGGGTRDAQRGRQTEATAGQA